MSEMTILGPQTRVRWNSPRPCGWAGNGEGTLINFDMERAYFGAKPGTGKDAPGPAYEVQLDPRKETPEVPGLRVWVVPGEVEALP